VMTVTQQEAMAVVPHVLESKVTRVLPLLLILLSAYLSVETEF